MENVGSDIDVFTANSAQEALTLLDAHKFDVVMTDVKMPGMSGVTLYHRIKANWPLCQVILLTGYRDFDTLYELADDKEVVYLLKSESDETIVATVEAAFARAAHAISTRQLAEDAQLEATLISKQHLLMTQWQADGADLATALVATHSRLDPAHVIWPAVLHAVSPVALIAQQERLLALYSLGQVVLAPNFAFEWLNLSNSDWLLIAQPQSPVSSVVFSGALQSLQEELSDPAMTVVAAATPQPFDALWRVTQQLMSAQLLTSADQEPSFIVAPIGAPVPLPDWVAWLTKFEAALTAGDFVQALSMMPAFDDLIGKLETIDPIQANDYLAIVREVLVKSYYVNHLAEHLVRNEGHRDKLGELHTLANRLVELTSQSTATDTGDIMAKLRDYIAGHLSENLTLERLAGIVYLNPSYLSRLFRQRVGVNLSEFIVQERIKRAKTLLATEQIKVADISEMVGYQSAHSFARVFRGQTGTSPREYRLRLSEQQL